MKASNFWICAGICVVTSTGSHCTSEVLKMSNESGIFETKATYKSLLALYLIMSRALVLQKHHYCNYSSLLWLDCFLLLQMSEFQGLFITKWMQIMLEFRDLESLAVLESRFFFNCPCKYKFFAEKQTNCFYFQFFFPFFFFFVNDRCTWQYLWPWVVHLSKQDSPVLPGCLCILRELLLRGVSQRRQKHDVHTKPSASWFIYREKGHINLLKGKEKWRIWLTLSV